VRQSKWQLVVAGVLLAVSITLYVLHYFIFKDLHHIFLWSLTSLAFLPVSVLLVTLLINRLLTDRDRKARLDKMNMVIGAFFSEVGNELLAMLVRWDDDRASLQHAISTEGDWGKKDLRRALSQAHGHRFRLDQARIDLDEIKGFLESKRLFLLRLLENPNLLEHEAFTALLRSVLHVSEELGYRPSLEGLPETDVQHLAGDLRRAYVILVRQWLEYLWFIRRAYPYLYSLAVRTNPFDPASSAVVE